jgi:hypothetical protein
VTRPDAPVPSPEFFSERDGLTLARTVEHGGNLRTKYFRDAAGAEFIGCWDGNAKFYWHRALTPERERP